MGLRNASAKMSKSSSSDNDRINITDEPDLIARKIRRAKTDSLGGFTNAADKSKRPELANLVNLYSIFCRNRNDKVATSVATTSTATFAANGTVDRNRNALSELGTAEAVVSELQSRGISTAVFKAELAEMIIEEIGPIGSEFRRLMHDKEYLEGVLRDGEEAAISIASETMGCVWSAIGM